VLYFTLTSNIKVKRYVASDLDQRLIIPFQRIKSNPCYSINISRYINRLKQREELST